MLMKFVKFLLLKVEEVHDTWCAENLLQRNGRYVCGWQILCVLAELDVRASDRKPHVPRCTMFTIMSVIHEDVGQ